MINGKTSEFLDKLYLGEELSFQYKEEKYFLEGWIEDEMAHLTLDKITKEPFKNYIWESSNKTMRECADEFLKLTIWSGKSFAQIEKEVIWEE